MTIFEIYENSFFIVIFLTFWMIIVAFFTIPLISTYSMVGD